MQGLNETVLGQGGGSEVVAHQLDPRGHHGGAGERVVSDGFGSAGQGDSPDRRDRQADPGSGRGDPYHAAGSVPRGRAAGPRDRGETADSSGGRPRRGASHRAAGHRGVGRVAATAAEAQRLLVNAKRALRRARAEAERLRKRGVQTRGGAATRTAGPRGRATKIQCHRMAHRKVSYRNLRRARETGQPRNDRLCPGQFPCSQSDSNRHLTDFKHSHAVSRDRRKRFARCKTPVNGARSPTSRKLSPDWQGLHTV